MTPFARKVYATYSPNDGQGRYSRENLRTHLAELLSSAVCFDMTQVFDLCKETSQALNQKLTGEEIYTEHGGLVFPPANRFWLEVRKPRFNAAWFGIIEEARPNDIFVKSIEEYTDETGQQHVTTHSGIIEYNEETFGIAAIQGGEELFNIDAIGSLGTMLIVLNAPYGIKRETQPRHKGHVREARRKGFELLPHHIITLDKSAPPKEYEAKGGDGTPRAFHFVRSHLRQYQSGLKTVVKAHWRGDPRLGIHRASYRVR